MNAIFRGAVVAITMVLFASPTVAADKAAHRIVIQVSQNDPERMNLALTNAQNAIKYYSGKGEGVAIEIRCAGCANF